MRRCQDDAVGLQGGNCRRQLPLDMVVMRVDQFHQHAIAALPAGEHAAEQHLVDPVGAEPGLPVGDGALPVVDRQDQVGPRTAHPLGCDRGDIAELVDTVLYPLLHFRADIGLVVDDAAHGLQGNPCIRCHMLDGDGLPPPRHREPPMLR